ncbi:MAG: acetylxylan esterase [Planctomycetaceae bacterium]|nr:acetylxylan esterase [Planctomycetaceae bacterium]
MPRLSTVLLTFLLILPATEGEAADSLVPLNNGRPPQNVEQLWDGYDPRLEPLDIKVVREWIEDGIRIRYVTFHIGTFKGTPARMAAFYAFPDQQSGKLPGLLQCHGGGQRANLQLVKEMAHRGYATLSINWGGRDMEGALPGEENTDWGAVDPTQNNVPGYSSLQPNQQTIDSVESPRNNNWFLLTIGARRGLTFLEQQSEVDAQRLGVRGHSMGGRLTGLVAGCDDRVKAASPSVGGSGFLQYDLWGLPGSARRVRGNLDLFRRTLSGEASLARIECPILYLSATNDFNAPMEFVEMGMKLVPHDRKRTTYAIHLNHRFTPEAEVARKLWFDAHLQNRLTFPESPKGEFILDSPDGRPVYKVTVDHSREVADVKIYYGYERDPRNRFWAWAPICPTGKDYYGTCSIYDLDEPLFVMANVYYKLRPEERREGDPEKFILSVADQIYPTELKATGIQANAKHHRLIDDFKRGWDDWYVLNGNNRHHWLYATRKLADPRWSGPQNGRLVFQITTTAPGNTLGVKIETDSWRMYAGRQRKSYTALVPLKEGENQIELSASDFKNLQGESLADWEGMTELIFTPGNRLNVSSVELPPWQGDFPIFANLRWMGGKVIERPYPYPQSPLKTAQPGGLSDPEFLKAIQDSLK